MSASASVAGNPGGVRRAEAADVPPWLWLWMALFLVALPDAVRRSWVDVATTVRDATDPASPFGADPWWLVALQVLPAAIEFVAPIALLAGVLSVALPASRRREVEAAFHLRPAGELRSKGLQDVATWVRQRAPHVEVTAFPGDLRNFAVVYPVGYGRCAIGLLGGLLLLWKRDRNLAEAALLHELAHVRQQDGLVVGAGSRLERAVLLWPRLTLALVIVPLAALLLGDWLRGLPGGLYAGIDPAASDYALRARVLPLLTTSGFITVLEMLWALSFFIPAIAAIWSTELNADRYAVQRAPVPQVYGRFLNDMAREDNNWRARLRDCFAHPWLGLRARLVNHHDETVVLRFALLLFPLAWAAMTAMRVLAYLLPVLAGRVPSQDWLLQAFSNIATDLRLSLSLPWFATGLVLVLWPLLARGSAAGRKPAVYLLPGAALLGAGLAIWPIAPRIARGLLVLAWGLGGV